MSTRHNFEYIEADLAKDQTVQLRSMSIVFSFTFSRSSFIPPINMPIKCALCSSVSSGVDLIALGNISNPSAESPQCPVFVHSFVDCVHSFCCARLLCCDSFPLSLWWCPSSSICMAVGVHNQHMYLHLISPWCPCLSIHFHDQQSIVHVGWVCVHGLYSKLLLYLFSKMLWVDIWSLTSTVSTSNIFTIISEQKDQTQISPICTSSDFKHQPTAS